MKFNDPAGQREPDAEASPPRELRPVRTCRLLEENKDALEVISRVYERRLRPRGTARV